MKYCLVLLMASACEEAPEDLPARCVMDVIGGYDTREQARAAAADWPAWTTPHIMEIREPDDT
jgi:hypothetical protein